MKSLVPPVPPQQDASLSPTPFLQVEVQQHYLGAAMLALVVYDCALTLGKEAEYIYTSRWSVPSTIFAVCRFFTFVAFIMNAIMIFWTDPTDDFCFHGVRFMAIIFSLVTAAVQLSLVMRVYAFWNCDRAVLFALLAFLVATFVASAILGEIGLLGVVPLKKIAPHLPVGCLLSPPKLFWAPLVPPLAFDATILALTVWRARWLGTNSHTTIIQHLQRTGIVYFIVIFVVFTFATISSIASPTVLAVQVIPSGLLAGIQSIMCSRLLLYIRAELRAKQAPRFSLDAAPRSSYHARTSLSGPTPRDETPSISPTTPSFIQLDVRRGAQQPSRPSSVTADLNS